VIMSDTALLLLLLNLRKTRIKLWVILVIINRYRQLRYARVKSISRYNLILGDLDLGYLVSQCDK